jgi:ATP-dependent 26S proteasome regulatory subunit
LDEHFHPFFQVHPEGKYVVDIDKSIDITKITPSTRVALRNDSYVLHLILPSKVDPLVNLMKVEKVPDSTYDMIGGLDQQIKEIKEVMIQCIRLTPNSSSFLFYNILLCLEVKCLHLE